MLYNTLVERKYPISYKISYQYISAKNYSQNVGKWKFSFLMFQAVTNNFGLMLLTEI